MLIKNHYKFFAVTSIMSLCWAGSILFFFVNCAIPQAIPSDKTTFYLINASTNNRKDPHLLEDGNALCLIVEYHVDQEETGTTSYWEFDVMGRPVVEGESPFLYDPVLITNYGIYTTEKNEANEFGKVKWTLRVNEFNPQLCDKNGTYRLFVRLSRWRKTEFPLPPYRVWLCNEFNERDFMEIIFHTPTCTGEDPVGGHFTGIIAYCGDERIGNQNEVMDYPTAYPITVQTIDNGSPKNGQEVKLTITSGSGVSFGSLNEGTTTDLILGDPTGHDGGIDHDDSECGCEEVSGVYKCPLVFNDRGDGLVEVTAEWINPPSYATQTTTTFKVRCLVADEWDMPSVENDKEFNERIGNDIIPGDGLFGSWLDPNTLQEIQIDPDPEKKDLLLEIDWLSDLGPNADIDLTFADIEYICSELRRLYAPLGINIVPVVNLNEFDAYDDPIHDPWEPVSVASQIDAHPDWNNAFKATLLKSYITAGKSNGFTPEMLSNLLMITRGDDLLGHVIWEVNYGEDPGEWENLPHYVRRRLHVVLLPGTRNGEPRSMGGALSEPKTDGPARYASGEYYSDAATFHLSFPWTSGNTASSTEKPIDSYGCCIFTGAFPIRKDVHYDWICHNGHHEYCHMLTAVIAHEVGHALGLAHHPLVSRKNDIMFMTMYEGGLDFSPKCQYVYSQMKFVEVYYLRKRDGRMINLRKVLGQTMTTYEW